MVKKVQETTKKSATSNSTRKTTAKEATSKKTTASTSKKKLDEKAKTGVKQTQKKSVSKTSVVPEKKVVTRAKKIVNSVDKQVEQSNKEISALLKNDLFGQDELLNKNSIQNNALKKIEKTDNNEKKKLYIKIGAAIAVILIVFLLCLKTCSSNDNSDLTKQRQNTIMLAKKYMDKGQYANALDLLNKLLIENADDEEVNQLLDKIIELKAIQDKENLASNSSNGNSNYPGSTSFDLNIDTDEITNAFKDSLDSMSKELSAANEANAKNQETINRLLEEKRKEEKALEQQKKQEEAKQKEKEEQLAKENKKNAEKIAKINDLINQGNANLNTGKSDVAIKKYEEAVKLLPLDKGEPDFSSSKYSEIASNLYDASEREKNPDTKNVLMNNAVKYAQKAIEKNPANAKAHFILAMNAEKNKNSALAESELELAVKNDPNNYLYYYYLGRRQYINKKYTQARTSFIASTRLNSNFDSSHYNLGVTCNKLNLSKDALAAFRKAYNVNPQHSKAYLEEARILNRVYKDYNGSIGAYNKVFAIEPDNMAALKECGSVYASIDKYSQAETCYRKVIANLGTTSDPLTYYNLSTVLYNQQKVEDAKKYAIESYNTKSSLDTKSQAMIVYNYALVMEKNSDIDKAILLYKEALSLNPSHTKAKTNLGIMFMEMNPPDVESALTFLTQAYNEDKKSFEVNNNLGNAYLLKKDFTNAINYYLNATKLKSKDIKVKENLAKAYVESSQFDNARIIYQDVIAQKADSYDSYIELAKVCIALKDTASAEGYLVALKSRKPEYRVSEVQALLDIVRQ